MSYAAASVTLGTTVLAASPTFSTLCGGTPLAHIIKTYSGDAASNAGAIGTGKAADGSDIDLSLPGWAVVGTDGITATPGGVSYPDREGTVSIRVVMPRTVGAETPAESADRAWETVGGIVDDIAAANAAGTGFADADVSVSGLFLDEDGVHRTHIVADITIAFRG